MQSRLTRSRTDKFIAGVCGGLSAYFNVDPVIVRLIFVLATFVNGAGIPIYLLLWLIVPRDTTGLPGSYRHIPQHRVPRSQQATPWFDESYPSQTTGAEDDAHEVRRAPARAVQQQRPDSSSGFSQSPPPPAAYQFDPLTGLPLRSPPMVGETINLRETPPDASEQIRSMPSMSSAYTPATPRRKNWRTLGIILVGVGGLILLEQMGITMNLMFPILLIVAGIILLKRRM